MRPTLGEMFTAAALRLTDALGVTDPSNCQVFREIGRDPATGEILFANNRCRPSHWAKLDGDRRSPRSVWTPAFDTSRRPLGGPG